MVLEQTLFRPSFVIQIKVNSFYTNLLIVDELVSPIT